MRRRTIVLAGLLGIAACASTSLLLDKGPQRATLDVEIRGLESEKGQIRLAVFGSPDGFPGDPERAERIESVPAAIPSVRWHFEDLPTGTWAVAVLHDEDANGKFATDWMGRPAEGWGVSNDARGRFGPPSFKDAAIQLPPSGASIVIHLSY